MRKALAAAIAVLAGLAGGTARAADPAAEQPAPALPVVLDQAVFGFVGRYDRNTLGESFNPFDAEYDDLTAVGAGYQRFVKQLPLNVRFGYEVGLAGRFGSEDEAQSIPGNTVEVWGGGLLRYDGFSLFDTVHVAASGTFGFSLVSDSSGYEKRREEGRGEDADATFLFFLAPEVSLSLEDHRNVELFARIQHRSGGARLLGDLQEAANAPVVGLRLFF